MPTTDAAPRTRVLMLTLEECLAREGQLLPHVEEALRLLARLEAAPGEPLPLCLVSEVDPPPPPVSPERRQALFGRFLQRLEDLGLRSFFEPVERRVTLSVHADAGLPARYLFETALQRLGVEAPLAECLLITGDATQVETCRRLGMSALRFAPGTPGGDFSDWSLAPLLVARRLDRDGGAAFLDALATSLQATCGLQVHALGATDRPGVFAGTFQVDHVLADEALGAFKGVKVGVPVSIELTVDPDGRVRVLRQGEPSAGPGEVETFARALDEHEAIAEGSSESPGTTHEVQTDGEGARRLVRRRFSAR